MRAVEIEIRNPSGLHARPAAVFVKAAAAFRSTVTVENLTREAPPVNAKSILSVIGLDVRQGEEIVITAEGDGADTALYQLAAMVTGSGA